MVLLALTALLAVGVPVGSAHQRHRLPTSINPDGSGTVRAQSRGSVAWEACTSRLTECKQWGRGREVQTRNAPAGTVFRVSSALAGGAEVSPEWKGRLTATAPPSVSGVVRANEYVSPVPGLWSGGWREESPEMQLSACETDAGEGCVSLTSRRFIRQGCKLSQGFLLNARFTGWYLRVADKRSGGPHAEALSAVYSPSGATWGFEEVWGRSRTVSVAVVGQISPAAVPAAGECGPAPTPMATISATGIARVECAAGCSVALTGTRDGRRRQVSDYIGEGSLLQPRAARELQLTRQMLSGLGLGKIRLTVEVEGQPVARRTIRPLTS